LDPALQQALAAFVDDARQALGVPGAAVVVVQGGDVIFLQGFGVREAGQEAALTPDTLLMIGSITRPDRSPGRRELLNSCPSFAPPIRR
jgi:CubicO group peptidase (beta-lactamase class C family)